MTTNGAALATTFILLPPMMYFPLAKPAFLCWPSNDPVVAWLPRGLRSLRFKLVSGAGALAAAASIAAGQRIIVVGVDLFAALASGARARFL